METYAEYLEHHGIKGQRWGITRTPEQLGHKKRVKQKQPNKILNALKGKSNSKDREAARREKLAQKAEKRRQAQEKKREAAVKKAEKKKELDEKRAADKAKNDTARREKILSDPALLYKHRKEFSKEEIDKAIKHIKMEQELRQLSMNQLSAGEAYLKTAVQYAETGIKVYNKAASIYNAFSKSDKDLPIIGGGKKKKKDKNKDDDDD